MLREEGLPVELRILAAKGLKLFPVLGRGKLPLVSGWKEQATTDPERLAEWLTAFPGCNWGAATGRCSGAFALDIDGAAGSQSLSRLLNENGPIPSTFTVLTARGKHLYLTVPQTLGIRNSVGRLAEGIDVRGDGGFVVVPPSQHQSGQSYLFDDPNTEIAEPPGWLVPLVARVNVESLPKFHKGHRNSYLARYAGVLRHKGATQRDIESVLLFTNETRCVPPLEGREVRRIAESIARYPIGGPDVLARAWSAVQRRPYRSTYERLLLFFGELQTLLPGKPVALPLQRIAEHMECDWTLIRRYRQRAKAEGFITEFAPYVYKDKAALFEISRACSGGVPLNHLKTFSSGTALSGTAPSGTPAHGK